MQHNSRFYLVDAKTPGATCKVLKHGASRRAHTPVKVDLLIANVSLDIPSAPRDRIWDINGLPTCPLAFLVILRLQGWDHHRQALAPHHFRKTAVDYRDLVNHLLPYARLSLDLPS